MICHLRSHRPSTAAIALALAALLLLGACGDDEPSVAAGPDTTVATETSTAPSTTAAPDAPTTVTVKMADYSFENLPESVPAGTTLAVENTSAKELHELVALRLPDGEQRSADELVALGEDGINALVQGPPTMVLVAKPGGEQMAALGDGTLAKAGRYLLVCSIPLGADPDEYLARSQQGPPEPAPGDGPPHLVSGMYAALNVT